MQSHKNVPGLNSFQSVFLFSAAVLILLLSMHYRMGVELADDAAFFLKYAENMLNGEFWVWNAGESPVWGASAPLYPLIVALTMALGLSPESAIIAVGLTLSSVSLAAASFMLAHRFGLAAGIGFFFFSNLDTGLMYFAGAGLETPLTIALLTLALATLLYETKPWLIGIVAGLIMVNKLDLIPVGILLLAAHWIQTDNFPKKALLIAGIVSGAWYGFALWYFGAPVPNSFITKSLYQNDLPKIIDWTWFATVVFWVGLSKWLTGFAVISLILMKRRELPIVIFLGGLLLVHTLAYTVKFPFEPYTWYTIPALFSLLVIASISLSKIISIFPTVVSTKRGATEIIVLVLLVMVFTSSHQVEKLESNHIKMFTSHHEFDRAEAGRWVDMNTPQNFTVFTSWGNPAYYSRREVIDGSFLNREFEEGKLVEKYKPEILILQNNPGSTPMNPVFAAISGEDYEVVRVFDKTYSAGMDYFFVVLARNDVLDQISNIKKPVDIMPYIDNIVLGDKFGILEPKGLDTLFIHPGESTATSFDFFVGDYINDIEQESVKIHARISPEITNEAINRGGGDINFRVLQDNKILVEKNIQIHSPLIYSLTNVDNKPLRFEVTNNGGVDSDWLLLDIN